MLDKRWISTVSYTQSCLKIPRSHSSSALFLCTNTKLRPDCLAQGDVVALMAGDRAPCRAELLHVTEEAHAKLNMSGAKDYHVWCGRIIVYSGVLGRGKWIELTNIVRVNIALLLCRCSGEIVGQRKEVQEFRQSLGSFQADANANARGSTRASGHLPQTIDTSQPKEVAEPNIGKSVPGTRHHFSATFYGTGTQVNFRFSCFVLPYLRVCWAAMKVARYWNRLTYMVRRCLVASELDPASSYFSYYWKYLGLRREGIETEIFCYAWGAPLIRKYVIFFMIRLSRDSRRTY